MGRFFLAVAASCICLTSNAQKALILSDARVDPAAQKIAFSAAADKAFAVYEQRLLGGASAVRVSPQAPTFHCFGPAYSPDGKYLLYLKEPVATSKKSNYADVVLYNRQTGLSQLISAGQKKITQALFAPDGRRIVYCAAGFFGSYSPVGPKAAHELDVFSMALDGSDVVQHTHLKAYALGNLALLQAPSTYLLNVFDSRQKLSGTYAFTLGDSTRLARVPDQNAEAHQLDYLPNLASSAQKTVVFSIANELFVKNMKNGASHLVYTGEPQSNPYPMSFVGNQNAILFSETLRPSPQASVGVFRIKLLNLDDLKTTTIPIQID